MGEGSVGDYILNNFADLYRKTLIVIPSTNTGDQSVLDLGAELITKMIESNGYDLKVPYSDKGGEQGVYRIPGYPDLHAGPVAQTRLLEAAGMEPHLIQQFADLLVAKDLGELMGAPDELAQILWLAFHNEHPDMNPWIAMNIAVSSQRRWHWAPIESLDNGAMLSSTLIDWVSDGKYPQIRSTLNYLHAATFKNSNNLGFIANQVRSLLNEGTHPIMSLHIATYLYYSQGNTQIGRERPLVHGISDLGYDSDMFEDWKHLQSIMGYVVNHITLDRSIRWREFGVSGDLAKSFEDRGLFHPLEARVGMTLTPDQISEMESVPNSWVDSWSVE